MAATVTEEDGKQGGVVRSMTRRVLIEGNRFSSLVSVSSCSYRPASSAMVAERRSGGRREKGATRAVPVE
jgi:hypothetical protein